MRTGQARTGNPRSGAPPESAIELAMDMIAVFESLGAHLARRAGLEVDVMLGAQRLQDGIETLTRPSKPLTQPMDGDPLVAGTEAVIGGLELPPEGVGLDEPRARLLIVEPGA